MLGFKAGIKYDLNFRLIYFVLLLCFFSTCRRFGFTNLEALEAGLTGQECRGEEHEIQLVWSITSGKRVVHVDNKEVHYSNNRGSTFEFSWTMRGNHVLKIVAHASAPITATKGFRQYNFYVDGLSFFSFPKVYRLNIPGREVTTYATSAPTPQGVGYPRGEEPSWKLEEPRTEQEVSYKMDIETLVEKRPN